MIRHIGRAAVAVAASGGMLLSLGLAQVPAGAASGPNIQWDYSMPDNIGPSVTGVVGTEAGNPQDLTGMYVPQNKMTADPDYPIAGNALYGTVPTDGKYDVILDACATKVSGDATYGWNIDGNFYATADCKVTRKLTEGTKNYTLRVSDDTGSSQVAGTFVVKNTLVAIIGDSYASGEGYPPFYAPNVNPLSNKPYDPDVINGKYVVDWDETSCQRSRWSGWVRAANQMEKADPHSSVTLIDVACAGAQMTENKTYFGNLVGTIGGILYPKRTLNAIGTVDDPVAAKNPTLPSQIDQLNALRKGQQIDVGMLSVGGNDLGLQYIMSSCIFSLGYDSACFADRNPFGQSIPTWQAVANSMETMPAKFKATNACLTTGDCKTAAPGQKVGQEVLKDTTPLGIKPENIIQAGYPNLLRDSNGQLCNRSTVPGEYWGDYVDDPAVYSKIVESFGAPFKESDAVWAEQVMLFGDGSPKNVTRWEGTEQSPWVPEKTNTEVTVTPKSVGLVQMLLDNQSKYGWSFAPDPYFQTTDKGLCADADKTVFYPVRTSLYAGPEAGQFGQDLAPVVGYTLNDLGVMHPNNRGQEVYRSVMYGDGMDKAGLPVAAKTQQSTDPTPMPINAPTKVKVKTNKKSCGSKYCQVKINFKAPKDGLDPKAYKIKTKLKGHSWNTLRQGLKKTHTTWKKAPWKKKKFQMKIASYTEEKAADGTKVQYISWTKVKTYKIKP